MRHRERIGFGLLQQGVGSFTLAEIRIPLHPLRNLTADRLGDLHPRAIDVNAHHVFGVVRTEVGAEDATPVTALRDVTVVAQTHHKCVESVRHACHSPAALGGHRTKAKAGQARDDEIEVSEPIDAIPELPDRAGPAMQ
ncbi:unannotated protein [freshwater metagenome]|uniref:Unannotated protein n=1 Tax=freshwater metagenome TaxID=449393 RepID=A0A6J7I3A7_9ZZZZ